MRKLKRKNPPHFHEEIKNLIDKPVIVRILNDIDQCLFFINEKLQQITEYTYRVEYISGRDLNTKSPNIENYVSQTFALICINNIKDNIITLKSNENPYFPQYAYALEHEDMAKFLNKKVMFTVNFSQFPFIPTYNQTISKLKYNKKENFYYCFKENAFLLRISLDCIQGVETYIEPYTIKNIKNFYVTI